MDKVQLHEEEKAAMDGKYGVRANGHCNFEHRRHRIGIWTAAMKSKALRRVIIKVDFGMAHAIQTPHLT